MSYKYSIVIPSYNHWELTHSLLNDIYRCFPRDVEVIVVDDYSTDEEVLSGLDWWKSNLMEKQIHIHLNKENIGFLKTSNYGISEASGDVVMLISNDVKISDFTVLDKVALAFENAKVPTLVGNYLLNVDTGWNNFDGRVFPYLEGWFLAFKKSEWVEFGGFDERYAPFDFEDVDISTEYKSRGGELVCINANMQHLGAQTYRYSPERESQTRRNQEKFKNKWIK